MPYNPRVANISHAEYEELMAIVRSDPAAERPLSDEDRWRRQYQHDQQQLRIAGFQPDLFGSKVVTHYHRHAPGPKVDREPEPIAAKLERIKDDLRHSDPCAPIDPPSCRTTIAPRSRAARPTGFALASASASSTHPAPWIPPSARSAISVVPVSCGAFAAPPSPIAATSFSMR
jgi:hypothetical protein